MVEEIEPTTLYVGGLDHSVSHDLLCTLFSQIGPVVGCKVLREPGYDPYAFVDFSNHQSASTALVAMNGRTFLGKEMKVNWASTPGNQPKVDTSSHYHVFVGDLSPEVSSKALREAFSPFGEISACRIVRDSQTLKSKGYAFVSFAKRSEAESAITSMNGQWLGSRCIRTNWSTRKPPPPQRRIVKPPSVEDVLAQTSPTNSTVYIGNCPDISDNLVQQVFSQFGEIVGTRVFKDKGYAFIKFNRREPAAHAITTLNNSDLNGRTVKCYWGKESGDMKAVNVPGQVVPQPAQWDGYYQAPAAPIYAPPPGSIMIPYYPAAAPASCYPSPYATYPDPMRYIAMPFHQFPTDRPAEN